MELRVPNRLIAFPRRPLLMGIVNINDDSFCGDGSLDVDTVREQTISMLASGADIIDVGAESARTNREAISQDEEIRRLMPFLETFQEMWRQAHPADAQQVWPPLLSVNTWRPEVVEAALPFGVDILNDIGALPDGANAALCAKHGAALLIMHSVGLPKQPHFHQVYEDVYSVLEQFFSEKVALAQRFGLRPNQIILDPGIDFAKQRDDNLQIFSKLDRLCRAFPDHPVLLPISRKTVIGEVLHLEDPRARDAGTAACLVSGSLRGAAIFRVHHVAAMHQMLKVIHAVTGQRHQSS